MPNHTTRRGHGPAPRPPLPVTDQRTHQVIFKVTEAEWAQLQADAVAAGQRTVSDYLRTLAGLPVRTAYWHPPDDAPA